MVSELGGPSGRARRSRAASVVLAVLALSLGVVGLQRPADAHEDDGSDGHSLHLQLAMSDPASYDRSVGGGEWGSAGAAHEFPPGPLCDDIVSFLARIDDTSDGADGDVNRAVEMSLAFDAVSRGTQPGVGYVEVVDVDVVDDDVSVHDGGSVAGIVQQGLTSPLFTPGAELAAIVLVTDVSPSETVLVRIDVRVEGADEVPEDAVLYARVDQGTDSGFREVSPECRDLGAGPSVVKLTQPPLPDTTSTTTAPTTTSTTTSTTAPTTTSTTAPTTTSTTAPTTTSTTAPTTTSTTAPRTTPGVGTDTALGSAARGSVTVTKRPDQPEASLGDVIGFIFEVRNTGTVPLTNLLVDDPRIGYSKPIASLAAGDTTTVIAGYTVTADDVTAGSIENVVTVSGDRFDPVTATATLRVLGNVGNVLTGVSVLPQARLTATTGAAVASAALPRTGTASDRMTWWAAALLVAGAAVLTAANGRRDLDQRGRV